MKTAKKIRPKGKKLPTLAKLMKDADTEFSLYIRRRHADEGGTVQCVTCNKLMFWTKDGAECGHFIKRGSHGVRYDERNCNVQCTRCNHWLGGNDAIYAVYIIDTYGREVRDELESWRGKEHKMYRTDYMDLIEKYKALNAELDKKFPRK